MTNYCTAQQVKDISKVSYDQLELADDPAFVTLIEASIARTEGLIDDYCGVPSTFFQAGGLTIIELHDGDGDDTVLVNYAPIVSVTKLEVNTAALTAAPSWSELSEGPGVGKHFLVYNESGKIYFFASTPVSGNQNIRITYKGGFAAVPKNIELVCAEVVARMLEAFTNRVKEKLGELGEFEMHLVEADYFSEELTDMLANYRHIQITSG